MIVMFCPSRLILYFSALLGRSQVPPPDAPASAPPHPALLPRPLGETKHQSQADESHARTAAPDPSASRVQAVPHHGADDLAAKDAEHVRRIDSVSRFGLNGVDGRAVGDLRGLQAKVDAEGLDDGSRDGEGAGVCANGYAGEADQLPQDDGVEWDDLVDDETRVGWTKAHCENANEGEQTDV